MLQYTIYMVPLILAAILAAGLAIYAWGQRPAAGALSLAALMLLVAEWSLCAALEIAGGDLPSKIFWGKLQYIAITVVPVALLAFALQYTQRGALLTRRRLLLLLVVPTITTLLAFTNEQHGLIWSSNGLDRSGPFLARTTTGGLWFWVHFAYSYTLMLLCLALVVIAFVRRTHVYRRQAAVLIVAMVVPWMGNILYFTGLNPVTQLDLTPFCLVLSGIMFTWGIFGFHLLDLTPIARAAVLEGMRDGVIVLDSRARVTDMNPAAVAAVGRTVGQVLGQPVSTLLDGWLDLLGEGELSAELQVVVGQGIAQRDFEARVSPLRDRQARLIGRLLVLRDVTEERRIERMRDDLTYTMVHDLRNPLTAIQVSLDVLNMASPPGSNDHELLQIAGRSSRHMLSLINAILDLSRLESGQMPIQRTVLPLTTLIPEMFKLLAPLADAKCQHMSYQVRATLPAAWADAELIQRVLQNLIGNAIKFTPDAGLISVATTFYESAPSYIQVSVSDTGPGVPEDIRARLFQKFVTGSNREDGSGLGLAFCRLAIEAHGGQIWLEDSEGPGTTFSFTVSAAT